MPPQGPSSSADRLNQAAALLILLLAVCLIAVVYIGGLTPASPFGPPTQILNPLRDLGYGNPSLYPSGHHLRYLEANQQAPPIDWPPLQ